MWCRHSLALPRSSGELSRLSADFKQLQEEQASIKGAVQNPPSGDRTALMAGATAGFAGAGSDRGAETARSKNMTNTQMMAQFEEDTKEQDAILDDLEAGADRLAHVGRAIGDEASAHIVSDSARPRPCAYQRCQDVPSNTLAPTFPFTAPPG